MRAIQFRSIEQLKRELEAMDFAVLPATSSAEASGRDDNQEKFSALL
jgi:hypothetical protein